MAALSFPITRQQDDLYITLGAASMGMKILIKDILERKNAMLVDVMSH